jgi:hypothetical protein
MREAPWQVSPNARGAFDLWETHLLTSHALMWLAAVVAADYLAWHVAVEAGLSGTQCRAMGGGDAERRAATSPGSLVRNGWRPCPRTFHIAWLLVATGHTNKQVSVYALHVAGRQLSSKRWRVIVELGLALLGNRTT